LSNISKSFFNFRKIVSNLQAQKKEVSQRLETVTIEKNLYLEELALNENKIGELQRELTNLEKKMIKQSSARNTPQKTRKQKELRLASLTTQVPK